MEAKPLIPAAGFSSVRPFGDADGAVISHAGRYARECVLIAFEMIGGVERLAAWADKNPDLFFTRLYPKVITKEVEINAGAGIEELLSQLDRVGGRELPPIDAEYTVNGEPE